MPSLPFEYGIFFEISHVVFVRRMKIEEKSYYSAIEIICYELLLYAMRGI